MLIICLDSILHSIDTSTSLVLQSTQHCYRASTFYSLHGVPHEYLQATSQELLSVAIRGLPRNSEVRMDSFVIVGFIHAIKTTPMTQLSFNTSKNSYFTA